MPDFRDYAIPWTTGTGRRRTPGPGALPARYYAPEHAKLPRLQPRREPSNRLDAVYEASKKLWLADYLPEDADGGELAPDGRVLEMLSEHTLEGWLEGYLLTGRHGFFSTLQAFAHVIDSMFNMHAKWLAMSRELPWRGAGVVAQPALFASTLWRQDHNGFTHQDPGFLDVVLNKSPEVCRIYLPRVPTACSAWPITACRAPITLM